MRPVLSARIHYANRTDRQFAAPCRVQGAARASSCRRRWPRSASATSAEADLATIWVTNPTRRLFGKSGPTKLDIAVYYAFVGDFMLPHILGRPVSLVRCPTGRPQDCFFQRHAFTGMPASVATFETTNSEGETKTYLSVEDAKGYLALAQFGVVEFHTWGGLRKQLDKPDRIVFDLDPGEGIGWREIVEAAVHIKGELEALEPRAVRQDVGRQGHPCRRAGRRRSSAGSRRSQADQRDRRAHRRHARRETFTTTMGKGNRKRRIFIDFHRNARGATAAAPYSLRARTNLPASTPVSWADLESIDAPEDLNYSSLPGLLAGSGDPWADIEDFARDLPVLSRTQDVVVSPRRRQFMAPRASWKGYLKLSLVSCPVRLYPATSASERITFNQLHKDTHNRINMKPVDPELGLVERSDLVKGYEYEDKKYIIIEDSDLEAVQDRIQPHDEHRGVRRRGLGRRHLPGRALLSGAGWRHGRRDLRRAARSHAQTGKLAIARLVLSSRERVVTIGARENGMFVCTLRNPNEVRGTAEYFGNIPVGKPDPEMLQLAEKLIEQKETAFDPKNYEDRYEIALMDDDQEKLKGHKPIIAAAPERGNVINLMDALKASLSQAKPPAKSKSKAERGQRRGARPPRLRPAAARPRPRARSDGSRRQNLRHLRRAGGVPAAAGRAGSRAPARAAAGAASRGAPRIWCSAARLLAKQSDAAIEARFDAELQGRARGRSARTASCGCSAWSNRRKRRR